MVKVGQIYTDGKNTYVVTNIWTDIWYCQKHFESIDTKGNVFPNNSVFYTEANYKLIAEYPTWQEAVNSKEFNNAD